jgi:uncharacterized protein (DUF433 family)
MNEAMEFWKDCPLIEVVPGKMSGAPVVRGTRVTPDALVENVESHMELGGLSREQAISATLKSFSTTTGGADTIRKLLAYQEARIHQLQP